MNERLKELAEQAGLKVESWMTNPPKPFQILGSTEQFEKFAELIVKECANYINHRTEDWDSNLRWIFNDGSGYMEVDVDSLLNEHFGVEE